ncbi:hypothetical protein LTSEJOH_0429, partial [Salmonella enterica subsp. enterica serovar Johannesburg str. S5-703]
MRYSRAVQEEYSYAPPIKKPDNGVNAGLRIYSSS